MPPVDGPAAEDAADVDELAAHVFQLVGDQVRPLGRAVDGDRPRRGRTAPGLPYHPAIACS